MIRSSVVLPDPDGPSNASSCPLGTSRVTSSRARNRSNRLLTLRTVMLMGLLRFGELSPGPPFEGGLDEQGDEGEQREQRRHRERPGHVVLLEQLLDAQRHRVGAARGPAR